MADILSFSWVEEFIANRFPDPYPESLTVRAYRAVAGLLLSAAILGTAEPRRLQEFTGYHAAFIAGVAWNMINSHLWNPSGYDCSSWLGSEGTIEDSRFLSDVDIALGSVWSPDADFSGKSFDTYEIFFDLNALAQYRDGRLQP